ncbi:MAG: FAD:protein FMN transferase [Gemmataceae bacterium]
MDRRDFLRSRQLAQAAGQALGAADELLAADVAAVEEVALLRLGWRAMATRFEVLVPFGTPDAVPAAQEAFELLDALEDQLTAYRDHSEVCRLNRDAFRRPVRVEAGLYGLLRLAADLHRESDGAFDVTSGRLIKAWGFFRGPRRVPDADELQAARAAVGMGNIDLDDVHRSIQFRCPGLEINLGSIGKGYALDRMAERLHARWNLPAILLHGGSSSVYAKGTPTGGEPGGLGVTSSGRGWRVRIRHPWIASRPIAEVWLRDRALGTSAATFQYLRHQGRKLGHILDPRTGWPAGGLASVSVVAPTAALADGLSTAFYVAGIELARRYCAAHPGVGAILLPEGTDQPTVIGLAPGEYNLLTRPK